MQKVSSTFMELERLLNRHAQSFAKSLDWDLGSARLSMTDCWINIMPHRTNHSLHLHPLSVISGTYYVTTPRGCPGLKFEDPRASRFMAAPPRHSSASSMNQTHVTYPAAAGNVILFESWLRHEVGANSVQANDYEVQLKKFDFKFEKPTKARYVKVVAKNFGKLPDWHLGAGGDAFIFIDEIEIK